MSYADSEVIAFAKGMNVLVGANNAGKSTILRAIRLPQPADGGNGQATAFLRTCVRASTESGEIALEVAEPEKRMFGDFARAYDMRNWNAQLYFIASRQGEVQTMVQLPTNNRQPVALPFFRHLEPDNFIYPYFTRRQPAVYQNQVSLPNSTAVDDTVAHLPSKVDRLCNPEYPAYEEFKAVCLRTLDLRISCAQYSTGKQAGLTLSDGSLIPIDYMGEGIINILRLLANVCSAKGKLFLIEEIENDIHPKALKRLLDFIIEKSVDNQFIISTHSNIVTKNLGGTEGAKVFSVEMKCDDATRIPTSSCKAVPDDATKRIEILESLGYEPSDFFLWKGYLILEESTAERLIRNFFVPALVPSLTGKLRTIAASGVSDVEARFCDLHRLFVFTHTCPQYFGKAWVAVDGGEVGRQSIARLKEKFKSWPVNHFKCFAEEDFEKYYPQAFQEEATEVLGLPNHLERQRAKGKLAEKVLRWARNDLEQAKREFEVCAKEIVDFLKEIATKLGVSA